MIRCVRLWTGHDDTSHVDVGRLDMAPGRHADLVSAAMSAAHVTVSRRRRAEEHWRGTPHPSASWS
jgi:hypothetical protein